MSSLELRHTLKISIIMAIRMLGLFMLFPVFSLYANDYQATPIMIGIVLGIYGLTQALFQIPFGYYSDKYGRKPLLIIGLLLFLLGSIIAALSDTVIGLIVGRTLQGMGAISSVLMATLADVVQENNRMKANAMLGLQIGAAFLIALIIAPSITHYFGLSALFWLIALLAILSLVLVITLKIPTKQIKLIPNKKDLIDSLKSVLHLPLLRLDLSIYLLHLLFSANFVVLPLILFEQLQLPLVDDWHFYLPVMLGSFILMLPFIFVAYRYQKTTLILLISIFGLSIVQFLLYWHQVEFFYLMTLLMVFFTFFNLIEASLPSLIAKIAPKHNKGIAMGVFSTSQFLGVFSGGLIGGWLYGLFELKTVFLFNSILAIFWGLSLVVTQEKVQ